MKSDIAFWALLIISNVWSANGNAFWGWFWLALAVIVWITDRVQRVTK
jgi:hypothetical protein